jgi:hypothetical protein
VVVDGASVEGVRLPFPLIVKPTREDASVGISRRSVVRDKKSLAARVAEVRARFRQPVLVERFIDGRELYVTLLGAEPVAMPMHEIDFSALPAGRPRIVSYDGKWDRARRPTTTARARCAPRGSTRRPPPPAWPPRAPPSAASSCATTRASICAWPGTARRTSSTSIPTATSPRTRAWPAPHRTEGSPIRT